MRRQSELPSSGNPQSDDVERECGEMDSKIEAAFGELSRPHTGPRRILIKKLHELARSGEAFSTQELWQQLRADHRGIGRATVFRAVEQLLSKGVLDKVKLSDGTHLYRVCGGSHHHHLVCTVCSRVVDFEECLSLPEIQKIGRRHGFAVQDHELTLYGTCDRCTEP